MNDNKNHAKHTAITVIKEVIKSRQGLGPGDIHNILLYLRARGLTEEEVDLFHDEHIKPNCYHQPDVIFKDMIKK